MVRDGSVEMTLMSQLRTRPRVKPVRARRHRSRPKNHLKKKSELVSRNETQGQRPKKKPFEGSLGFSKEPLRTLVLGNI